MTSFLSPTSETGTHHNQQFLETPKTQNSQKSILPPPPPPEAQKKQEVN